MFIADDHAGYRGGMARMVGDHPSLEVVGEAADGNEALLGVVALQPDVALLDIRMPGLTGLEVCRRLHAEGSAPATICAELVAAGEGRVGWAVE